MKLNPKYVLLVSEALIPLLGFFSWNWSLYFILLFYFLDLVAQEVIVHLKTAQIVKVQGKTNVMERMMYGFSSLLLLVALVLMAHLVVRMIHPNINFTNEIELFWTYKEFGVEQGWILLPIVAFAAYQQYKMSFLMRGLQRTVQVSSLWRKHMGAISIALAFASTALVLEYFFAISELVYVVSIVVLIGVHNFFFKD